MKTEEIAKNAEIDLGLLPVLKVHLWFPLGPDGMPVPMGWVTPPGEQGPTHAPMSVWTVGKPPPDDAKFTVLALFADVDEIRVYAVGSGKIPRRYTLSKHAALIGIEHMTEDVMRSQVEEELQAQTGDDEVGAVVEAILETLQEKGFAEAHALIKDEFTDDEDEDEQAPASGTSPTQPAPAEGPPRF